MQALFDISGNAESTSDFLPAELRTSLTYHQDKGSRVRTKTLDEIPSPYQDTIIANPGWSACPVHNFAAAACLPNHLRASGADFILTLTL